MPPADPRPSLSWLLRLRWLTAACQSAALIASLWLLPDALATGPLLALVALGALSNLLLAWRLRTPDPVSPNLPGAVLALDILLLTALLYGSGGPANPFTVVYLVHITLAAVVMRGLWAWGLGLLSIAGYGLLFVWHVHVHALAHMDHEGGISLHLVGMWVAFTITAALIARFVGRATTALRDRDAEVARLQDLAQRQNRLAALTTLAAGVAHELGTPLGTIALAAAELERGVANGEPGVPSLKEDAALIRQEVARCREILDQLTEPSGTLPGEGFQSFTWDTLETHVRRGWPEAAQARLTCDWPDRSAPAMPLKALARTLRALVSNAFEASDPRGGVRLRAFVQEGDWGLEVTDEGHGMTPEVQARIGEPFFTTKEPGSGMGLGLFLTRTFMEQSGGAFTVLSTLGKGTRVRLSWPGAHHG